MDSPNSAPGAADAPTAPLARQMAYKPSHCLECGESFVPNRPQQVFCKPKCKTAFQNRAAVDGRAIIALAKAWRLSRNAKKGSPNRALGAAAFGQMITTLDNMLERDRSEGRTPQMAFDYVRSLFWDGRDWRDRARTSTWGKRDTRAKPKPDPEPDPALAALEAIANGHNDPRALASAILALRAKA